VINKIDILLPESVRVMNRTHGDAVTGFYAVDSYYKALRDVGFITPEEYMSAREVNNQCYNDRKKESTAYPEKAQSDDAYCVCNPNEAPYKVGSKLCAVCKLPRR